MDLEIVDKFLHYLNQDVETTEFLSTKILTGQPTDPVVKPRQGISFLN